MINRILAIAAFLVFAIAASSAQGATAISFSEPDNTYGWCTGYSTSEAPGCAREWCEKSNGQQCQLALVCDAGWNAVAFADTNEATGFGAACDVGSTYNARLIALTNCIVASQAVCFVDSTFDGSGNERSKDSNREFDLTWYVQGLLHGLGYDPGTTDGEFGGRTRTAIRAFQADMGLDQTGEVSEDLFYILLTKNGGVGFLVAGMAELQKTFTTDEKSRSFGAANAPLGGITYSDELRLRNTAVQRIMLADYLRFNDRDCPIPAASATVTDIENGVWAIECSNGSSYTLTLSADGKSDTIADNNVQQPTETETQVAETGNEQAQTGTGETDIVFAHSSNDSWGACTGDRQTASDCAVTACTDFQGTDCSAVISCPSDAWSAVAFSTQEITGTGIACGYTESFAARRVALAECMYQTHSICRVAGTIRPDGGSESDDSNTEFTRIYHMQAMLSIAGLYDMAPDGIQNDATVEATMALQTKIGLEPTGEIDDATYGTAYYVTLGTERYVTIMNRDVYGAIDPSQADYRYGVAASPASNADFSGELNAMSDSDRRHALSSGTSALLRACTIPASSVTDEGNSADGHKWTVVCDEGAYEITFANNEMYIADASTPSEPEAPVEVTPSPGKDKGGPAATPTKEKTKG